MSDASTLVERASSPVPFDEVTSARWFFENSQDLFAVAVDGRFTIVNAAWTRVTGWSVDELVGRPCIELVHEDCHAEFSRAAQEILATGATTSQLRVACKDGGWVWLQGHSRLGPTGEMIGSLRDTTAEVARKAELATARRTRELLAEAAGVGLWSYEPATRRIEWSSDILMLTGLTVTDMETPDKLFTRLSAATRDGVRGQFTAATLSGASGSVECRLLGANDRWFTFRVTFGTEPRGDGLFALKGIAQNITEVAHSRDTAVDGERQARRLVEQAPFAVALYDRDLRVMVVSPKFLEIFHTQEENVLGKTLHELTHGARRRFVAGVVRALAGETVVRREDRLQDADGDEHCLRWEARPWRDADGEIAGVITYMDDVTALSEARREARANARRLKIALGAAQAGVYEIDHAAERLWGSPEFHRMLGRRITYEDVRRGGWPMMHPDDIARLREAVAESRDGGRPSASSIEARLTLGDEQERWVRIFHEVRRDTAGKIRKSFGLILDIDEQKRAELALVAAERAALAAGEAKAQFLANMSHEIRTPMNGVLGVMHLLKREGLPDSAGRLLGEALACGQMLSTLLDDVIDFSRIEAGRLDLAREPVDPRELAHSVARLLRAQASHKGLALEVDAPELGWVLTDPTRLRQALFNLVGNAVKFTLAGSVTLKVRREAASKGGDPRLVFEVVDTGVGIPAQAQDRLFERFQQADPSTTRRFGGSGLGLAITRRLAEMLGGAVDFTSREGHGSTFILTIAAPAAAPPAIEDAGQGAVLRDLRILVVEDNPTNQMVATRILEQLGASVETADDGMGGVEAARRGFDLILMDVQMPGIDGPEAARRIRALPGAAARTPIIALTANVLAHQRAAYLAAGMDGVAAKPIAPAALIGEILRLTGPASDRSDAVA